MMDWSNEIPDVIVNETRAKFETKEDARFFFELMSDVKLAQMRAENDKKRLNHLLNQMYTLLEWTERS
jgi:hypothetical protein